MDRKGVQCMYVDENTYEKVWRPSILFVFELR